MKSEEKVKSNPVESQYNKVKHSASVCWHKGEKYIAYYMCEHEGWTQVVHVVKTDKNNQLKTVLLTKEGKGYGNPVIFSFNDNLYIAMTKFRSEFRQTSNVSLLWRNTDMFLYHLIGKKFQLITVYPYLGVRCAPYIYGDKLFLPCYDETRKEAVILQMGSKHTIIRYCIFGNQKFQVIQPSIIVNTNELWCICRNFQRPRTNNSVVEFHIDFRATHNLPTIEYSKFPNYNESVLLFCNKENYYAVYGNKNERKELVIVKINKSTREESESVKININSIKGCYPNYCWNPDGTFDLVYTSYDVSLSKFTNIQIVNYDSNLKELSRSKIA